MRKRSKNITPEQIARMRELEAQGITRTSIAAQFGCSVAAVSRRLGKKEELRSKLTENSTETAHA